MYLQNVHNMLYIYMIVIKCIHVWIAWWHARCIDLYSPLLLLPSHHVS